MSENEVRRLELKSRLLNAEMARLELAGRNLAWQLKEKTNKYNLGKSNWTEFLKRTIERYNLVAPELKSESIKAGLKVLKEGKQILQGKNTELEKAKSELAQINSIRKQKEFQLSDCQKRFKLIQASKTQVLEQVRNEDAINCKTAFNRSSVFRKSKNQEISSEKLDSSLHKSTQPRELRSVQNSKTPEQKGIFIAKAINYLNVLKESNSLELPETNLNSKSYEESYLDDNKVGQCTNVLTPSKVFDEKTAFEANILPPLQALPIHHFSKSPIVLDREISSISRWVNAEKNQNVLNQHNQEVKIAINEGPQGTSINLDYAFAPGRMISIAGASSTSRQGISIGLKASNAADHSKLTINKSQLKKQLLSDGIKVEDFEIIKQ